MNYLSVQFQRELSKPIQFLFICVFSFFIFQTNIHGQKVQGNSITETVTDFDGNTYNIINIGNQKWMKESLKSLHYTDSSAITGVMAYNNNENLAATYGRLYTWNAAMKNGTASGTQGVCPKGWHLPSDEEWSELVNFLGGENVAGGHLKEAGTYHWSSPNSGGDNSSGFTALPSGMYFDGGFNYLRYNVEFWSSSDSHDLFAWYRILYYDQRYIVRTDYFDKNSLRSVRCLCNEPTGIKEAQNNNETAPNNFRLEQNWPNPFNPKTKINYGVLKAGLVILSVYDLLGQEVAVLVNEQMNAGSHFAEFDAGSIPSGVYIYTLQANGYSDSKKMIVLK